VHLAPVRRDKETVVDLQKRLDRPSGRRSGKIVMGEGGDQALEARLELDERAGDFGRGVCSARKSDICSDGTLGVGEGICFPIAVPRTTGYYIP
jgi:hypothetical protein